MPNDNMLMISRALLQDLFDDVSDYACSREFRAKEKAWRDDLLARVRSLLTAYPGAPEMLAAHPGQPEPKEPSSPDDIQGWSVTVEVNGVGILTISDNCVSGIDNIADFDGIVRNCAQHLIGFIGQPEPRAEVTDEQIADMFERVTGYSIENGRAALNDADILGFARELLEAARAGEAS
ncbi:hypothetical protein KDW10_22665 [Burkholderia vietnamiensis]|uniref:hypothetical protein n=1 Tax=Burkholderia vietnamiensis TaxID=60552 RepID=UPI001BA22F49|nr:hypothetical protein [Burkholderia vietnamiensis]MBR8360140.1 hypothetical protein [Burkholderia vietnamiensis]